MIVTGESIQPHAFQCGSGPESSPRFGGGVTSRDRLRGSAATRRSDAVTILMGLAIRTDFFSIAGNVHTPQLYAWLLEIPVKFKARICGSIGTKTSGFRRRV